MIDLGCVRVNVPYQGKFYVSYIGRFYLKKISRTATQAKEYVEKVNSRYESLRKAAS